MKGPNRTPHTACRRGKRVLVVLTNGDKFIDKFWERTGKWVQFKQKGKINKALIKSFTIYKGPNMYEHSNCCNAPAKVESGDDGDIGNSKEGVTNYYVCTKCDNPCDVH